jgi:hypothetical protein
MTTPPGEPGSPFAASDMSHLRGTSAATEGDGGGPADLLVNPTTERIRGYLAADSYDE